MRLTYAEARDAAVAQLMVEDRRVFVIGGYVGRAGGIGVSAGGAERYVETPIAEHASAAMAVGAALMGLRPLVALTASFSLHAFPPIINEAAKYCYSTGGQSQVGVVFVIKTRMGDSRGAQHTLMPQTAFWNSPGIEIAVPSTPGDYAGVLLAAFDRRCPVVVVESEHLRGVAEDLPERLQPLPFGQAAVRRTGGDVTLLGTSWMAHVALEAAERLASEGIEAEVVDPRTLVPLDRATILASVARTGRIVIADDSHRSAGVAAALASVVAEEGFHALKAPVRIVATPDVPMPLSPPLEAALRPGVEQVVSAARSLVRG